MKRTLDDLAIFGGPPLFDTPRPIGQLAMGDPAVFFSHARRMYESGRLTNNGPLALELEKRLASLHQTNHCVAFLSASAAIVATLKTLGGKPGGEVIMPAFTYVGLPHLARWAGYSPRFCDIHADTHTLDPDAVASLLARDTVAVLGVHQVNSPCHIAELQALADGQGAALLFDAVHAVGQTYRGRPVGGFGRAEIFSLHATKLINGFEGGYVTTNDDALAARLRLVRNFGFVGQDVVVALGFNGKLNEVHAALALTSLEGLPDVVARNRERYDRYCASLAGLRGLSVKPYPDEGRYNYEFVLMRVDPALAPGRDPLVELLRSENALARAYYSPPLHLGAQAPPGLPAPSLPVTEEQATLYIQMPVGERVDRETIERLAGFLAFVVDRGDAIAERLGE